MRRILHCLAALALLVFANAGLAQPYPAKPVRMIIPWAAGGTTDILGRILAQKMAEKWGQPVLVENRGGAAGNIGTEAVVRAPADGYTLLLGTMSTHAMNQFLYTGMSFDPPAKFVFSDQSNARVGIATDSLVSDGCIISGGQIHRSVLSAGVRVNSFAHVEQCILLEGVRVGRYARLRKVIIDKDVEIPQGMQIGFDLDEDRKRFTVSEDGMAVLMKRSTKIAPVALSTSYLTGSAFIGISMITLNCSGTRLPGVTLSRDMLEGLSY